MSNGRVFFVDSASGSHFECNSPMLLRATQQIAKFQAVQSAMATGDEESQALTDDIGTIVGGVAVAKRPVDFALFSYAAVVDTYNKRAIDTKALDITGRNWHIVEAEQAGRAKKYWKSVRKQGGRIAELTTFFQKAWGKRTFAEGMGCVWTDFEALANAYVEVVPDKRGVPVQLVHIPASEMWVRLDEIGYTQQKNGKVAHFRDYCLQDKAYAKLKANDPLSNAKTHGVIHWSRYSPWSRFYGVPQIMPAWNAVVLRQMTSEFNLRFFSNGAIPDWAVILEEGPQGGWPKDSDDTLREFFRAHLKGVGNSRKTLVLTAPNGGKVTFERLTSDTVKDGAFPLLRKDSRDEILHAHGVHPIKAGIVEAGKLGGNMSTEEQRAYKAAVVDPGGAAVEARLNQIIEKGFGEPNLRFEFAAFDVEDQLLQAQIDQIYLDRQVKVVNEVRAQLGMEQVAWGDEPNAGQQAGLDAGVAADLAALQKAALRALEARP